MTDAPDYLRELDGALRHDPLSRPSGFEVPRRPLRDMQENALPELVEIVKACLLVPNGSTRKGAAYSLAQIGEASAVPALKERLGQEEAQGNREAIEAAIKVLEAMPRESGSSEEKRRKAVENAYFGRPLDSDEASPYSIQGTTPASSARNRSGCAVVIALIAGGLWLLV